MTPCTDRDLCVRGPQFCQARTYCRTLKTESSGKEEGTCTCTRTDRLMPFLRAKRL